jgi:hypothetical protein
MPKSGREVYKVDTNENAAYCGKTVGVQAEKIFRKPANIFLRFSGISDILKTRSADVF